MKIIVGCNGDERDRKSKRRRTKKKHYYTERGG
jgi:hypothetical protein